MNGFMFQVYGVGAWDSRTLPVKVNICEKCTVVGFPGRLTSTFSVGLASGKCLMHI